MKTLYKKTTKQDQLLAEASVPYLKRSADGLTTEKGIQIKIQETGETITIPKNALLLLTEILDKMAHGKSITILPSDSDISTQQAADMLNVSRPHIVKILEKGEIPFNKVGSHRRIKLSDIIAYDKVLVMQRRKNIDALAKQARELKLGYE